RRHKDGNGCGAIDDDTEIELPLDLQPFFNEKSLNFASFRAGLMGDQLHAQDPAREIFSLFRSPGQLYSAAFAASTRMYLRFDDDGKTEFLDHGAGFLGGSNDLSARNFHSIFGQQSFGLILMNFHSISPNLIDLQPFGLKGPT